MTDDALLEGVRSGGPAIVLDKACWLVWPQEPKSGVSAAMSDAQFVHFNAPVPTVQHNGRMEYFGEDGDLGWTSNLSWPRLHFKMMRLPARADFPQKRILSRRSLLTRTPLMRTPPAQARPKADTEGWKPSPSSLLPTSHPTSSLPMTDQTGAPAGDSSRNGDSQQGGSPEGSDEEPDAGRSERERGPETESVGELAPPPLSEIGKDRSGAGDTSDEGSESQSESEALEDPARLRELQESLGRLEDFAAQAQAENTIRAYAADLEDFRHWCKKYDREWLPAEPKTIGLYLGARADRLSLSTLERRLAAIASLHKEEGYESPASVAEGPLRRIWKGIVREKTRQQDAAPPLMVEDLRSIIEHLPRYSSSAGGPTGQLTLTSLRDRALLLVGWTGALRRSELVALTTEDIQFIEGEGVNIYVRRSKSDQEAEGLVKGLPYGSNKETCPVTALRQWLQAADRQVDGPFEGDIFRRFYRGESIGESAMTAQYVSTVLKRHAESAGLDPDEYSAHSLRAGFITQAIRAGKAERRVKEHSGHESWETFNEYVEEAGTFQDNPAEGIGL